MRDHVQPVRLDAYSEGQLPPMEKREVEGHLAQCGQCQLRLARLRELGALCRQLPREAPPPDLGARILWAISRRVQAGAVWRRLAAVSSVTALAGIAFVAVSWSEVSASLAAGSGPDLSAWGVTIARLLEVPMKAISGLVNGTLAWEAQLGDQVGTLLLLGVMLLTIAAFGGLARLLWSPAPFHASG